MPKLLASRSRSTLLIYALVGIITLLGACAEKSFYRSAPVSVESVIDDRSEYPDYQVNPITLVNESPISTFSIDVDTSAYSVVRSHLERGVAPPASAVRTEELVNYFDYDYPIPNENQDAFNADFAVIDAPWSQHKKLLRIGIQAQTAAPTQHTPSNLVFLIDVSGSMSHANKLPLLQQSMKLLLKKLKPEDTVSIVVYAGASGIVLEPTPVANKSTIVRAINRLRSGGATAGAEGLQLAYEVAQSNYIEGGVNRILLGTDGDFNVGPSSNDALLALIKKKRELGIYLSVLGFGTYNYQDDMMQTLAQNGNGIAAYIDTLSEAKKVLFENAYANLYPVANDVKIQIEFNPTQVSEYRLLGYETRALARSDFNNDKVDAGEIGSGHRVTALYEITPADAPGSIDALRYGGHERSEQTTAMSSELAFLKLRYKLPHSAISELRTFPIAADTNADSEAYFAASVAAFSELLRGSDFIGDFSYQDLRQLAKQHIGSDAHGYRKEFIKLVEMAELISLDESTQLNERFAGTGR